MQGSESLFSKIPKPDPIVLAVHDAQVDPELGFPRLSAMIEPAFRRIAHRIASQCVDDAVQCAVIKVWKQIDKIDLGRPSTVNAMIMTIGVRAMRDEVRRVLRAARLPVLGNSENVDIAAPEVPDKCEIEFEGVLVNYLKYVRETGSASGAHKWVGEQLGVTTARASTMFHIAARKLIDKLKEQEAKEKLRDTESGRRARQGR